jgi:hypothetical protein
MNGLVDPESWIGQVRSGHEPGSSMTGSVSALISVVAAGKTVRIRLTLRERSVSLL